MAALLDGVFPLPFLAGVFPPWVAVVVLYQLFADGRGASPGKRLMGLEVVALQGELCGPFRSLVRNVGVLAGLLGALVPPLAPLSGGLLFIDCLLVAFSTEGRHLGDRLAGTQVVSREIEGS